MGQALGLDKVTVCTNQAKCYIMNTLLEAIKMRLLFLLLLLPIYVDASTTVLESGNVVSKGEYKTVVSGQYMNGNNSSGAHIIGQVETGISDSESIKVTLGTGLDHTLGGSYKWVPFPDTNSQPALGGVATIRYSVKKEDPNALGIHLGPIVSKYIQFANSAFDIYSSMLVGPEVTTGDINLPVSFNLGAEIEHVQIPDFKLYTELAIGLTKSSYNIVGVGLSKLF